MKKFVMTAALALVSLLALPNQADAGIRISVGHSSNYVSGHASCGCPIYTRRVCYGHDRYHRPLYRNYRQPFSCRHQSRYSRSSRSSYGSHGYYTGHSSRSSYGYRNDSRRHSSGHRGSYGSSRSCR